MVHMAWAYLTEKQMPRSFWFFAIMHAACMMNAIPGKVDGRLASPFLLVHGVGHTKCIWTPLFSLCYFHHTKDEDLSCSKHQAHTMDGIIVGRSPTSNALLVYNPHTKKYYEPNSYRLTLINFRVPFILTLNMTVVSSALSIVTTTPPSRRNTLLVLGLSILILHLTCFLPGP
jgi:hypothetical protein